MSKDLLYLRQNVQVEPLIDHWYAWSHLIPPATAARNITERHLKIMNSYINSPMIHANAVKNPKMLGGPFIDQGGQRVAEIRELRDRIKRERAHLIELSAALGSLEALLRESACRCRRAALDPSRSIECLCDARRDGTSQNTCLPGGAYGARKTDHRSAEPTAVESKHRAKIGHTRADS